MSTPAYVDSKTITQADEAQSFRVLVPLRDDTYVAVRQAQLVDTNTKSDLEEAPSEAEESQPLGSRVPLMSEEFEASEPSGTKTISSHSSVSSDSTAPLSPDHTLTHVSPTPTPIRVSFHCSTASMVVRTQPTLSPGMSVRIAEAAALSPSSYHTDSDVDELGDEDTEEDEEDESLDANDERERSDDEGHGLGDEDHGLDDESQGLEDEGLGLEKEEAVPEGQQQAVLVVETAASEPLRLGYGALRRRELAVGEDQVHSTFEVGQSSRSVPEQQGTERVSAFRQPTFDTWVDLEDGRVYTDIPAYVPLDAPVQTPPSPEWSLGSLSALPSSLVVSSPIASPVATLTATISVDEDQFIEVGAQLELHGSILHDHTQRLDALPPTLVADIDRDVRELYTRSEAVRDEIFSQRYKFRSLKRERERAIVTFGALWKPVLALEAWAGHVDTRLTDMSRASGLEPTVPGASNIHLRDSRLVIGKP
ncbi:hypothetical protein Tco_0237828 [Tanacetum coccineum]